MTSWNGPTNAKCPVKTWIWIVLPSTVWCRLVIMAGVTRMIRDPDAAFFSLTGRGIPDNPGLAM
jgi:hypothetical protein